MAIATICVSRSVRNGRKPIEPISQRLIWSREKFFFFFFNFNYVSCAVASSRVQPPGDTIPRCENVVQNPRCAYNDERCAFSRDIFFCHSRVSPLPVLTRVRAIPGPHKIVDAR